MSNAPEIVKKQRDYFNSGATRSYDFRIKALEKLKNAIEKNENKIFEAMKTDLGKSAYESYETEIALVLGEIKFAMKHLAEWMRPKHVLTPIVDFIGDSKILAQPYGVTLIMSPWNYPFLLTMEPYVGSIAAGNTTVLKPSDYSSHTSQAIADLVQEIFPEEYTGIMLGGHQANSDLLAQHFDYIFFTGSVRVGKIVMQAAANFVTPLTLELGGKSPCIVYKDCDVDLAAKRIAWGKYLNSGQTCVCPDHLYLHSDVKDEFIAAFKKYVVEFYTNDPLTCDYYPHVINQKHFDRLSELLQGTDIIMGGKTDPKTLRIEPTLVDNVKQTDPLMAEEIFGPILPILNYTDLDDVMRNIKARQRPLAFYIFTKNKEIADHFIDYCEFGGGCINDVVEQLSSSRLPFGGVGNSGMGMYHGEYSFNTFSHFKGILDRSKVLDIDAKYMPPTEKKFKILRKMLG